MQSKTTCQHAVVLIVKMYMLGRCGLLQLVVSTMTNVRFRDVIKLVHCGHTWRSLLPEYVLVIVNMLFLTQAKRKLAMAMDHFCRPPPSRWRLRRVKSVNSAAAAANFTSVLDVLPQGLGLGLGSDENNALYVYPVRYNNVCCIVRI